MPISLDERVAILQDIAKSRVALQHALRAIPQTRWEVPGVCGDWSIKVLLGHIAAWEELLIERIEAIEEGEGEDLPAPDVDRFNAERAAEDAARPLDEVLDDYDETHADLMDLLEVTPVLSRELVAGDTFGHYPEHTAQITAWAKQQAKR